MYSGSIVRHVFSTCALIMMLSITSCDKQNARLNQETTSRTTKVETTYQVPDRLLYKGAEQQSLSEWELDTVNGKKDAYGLEGSISFYSYGEMNGRFSCTSYIFTHRLNENEMLIGRKLFDDVYDCQESKSAEQQRRIFVQVLKNVRSIEVEENLLTLTGDNNSILTFSPPEPPTIKSELMDTRWILTSLKGSAPLPRTRLTLEINEYAVSLDAGCNSFGSEISYIENGLFILSGTLDDSLLGTDRGCPGSKGEQEKLYIDTFYGVSTYRLTGNQLLLYNDGYDGKSVLLLAYRRAA